MEALRFDYEDAKGIITTRELVNWKDNGWLVKGRAADDGGFRTFRRDRIIEVHSGGEQLKPIRMPQHLVDRSIAASKANSDNLEILFTGFPKDRRAQLEAAAFDAGIQVRKTVTQALSFICAGPNAGPTKLRKAQSQGVAVLDESDFLWLLETGEMPE
ncbi:MAG: BRCT domain-containing protein [Pseudomonadota bacterium]